jgi:hypothetical protein
MRGDEKFSCPTPPWENERNHKKLQSCSKLYMKNRLLWMVEIK